MFALRIPFLGSLCSLLTLCSGAICGAEPPLASLAIVEGLSLSDGMNADQANGPANSLLEPGFSLTVSPRFEWPLSSTMSQLQVSEWGLCPGLRRVFSPAHVGSRFDTPLLAARSGKTNGQLEGPLTPEAVASPQDWRFRRFGQGVTPWVETGRLGQLAFAGSYPSVTQEIARQAKGWAPLGQEQAGGMWGLAGSLAGTLSVPMLGLPNGFDGSVTSGLIPTRQPEPIAATSGTRSLARPEPAVAALPQRSWPSATISTLPTAPPLGLSPTASSSTSPTGISPSSASAVSLPTLTVETPKALAPGLKDLPGGWTLPAGQPSHHPSGGEAPFTAQPMYYAKEIRTGTNFDVNRYLGASFWYSQGYTGQGARVANIEAGFAHMDHEMLKGLKTAGVRFWTLGALAPGDFSIERNNHATAVSSNIVGRPGTDKQTRGIAYGVQKGHFWTGNIATALYHNGRFDIADQVIFDAYKWALITGIWYDPAQVVDVVNSSWGADDPDLKDASGSDYSRIIDALIVSANDGNPSLPLLPRHGTVVFAAGNSGRAGTNSIGFPGSSYNVFTVGSVGPYNDGHIPFREVSVFSSRGPQDYFHPTNKWATAGSVTGTRAKVEIVAPGDFDWLASPQAGLRRDPNRAYASVSGTSFAAPDVTGAIALMASYARDKYAGFVSAALDARVVKAVLMNSAAKTAGWDNGQQYPLMVVDNPNGHRTGQSLDYAAGAGLLDLSAAWKQYMCRALTPMGSPQMPPPDW